MGGMYYGVANPDMSGINTSARCGSYTRNAVENFDYFIALPAGGFTNLNDFTNGDNFFTLDGALKIQPVLLSVLRTEKLY